MSFVEAHGASADLGGICAESRPLLARSEAGAAQAVQVAAAPAVEIGGVPAHNLPSLPYRREESAAVAAPDYDADDTASAENEPLAPPPAIARALFRWVSARLLWRSRLCARRLWPAARLAANPARLAGLSAAPAATVRLVFALLTIQPVPPCR